MENQCLSPVLNIPKKAEQSKSFLRERGEGRCRILLKEQRALNKKRKTRMRMARCRKIPNWTRGKSKSSLSWKERCRSFQRSWKELSKSWKKSWMVRSTKRN